MKLTATSAAAGFGRLLVSDAMRFWRRDEDEIDTAKLIMSELVTNAVLASAVLGTDSPGGGRDGLPLIAAQMRIEGSSLFAEVWDASRRVPHQRTPDNDSEGGRGLLLVNALSEQWAVSEAVPGGKVVFARLELKDPPAVSIDKGREVPLSQRLLNEHVTGSGGQHEMADKALVARIRNPLTML